MTELKGQLLELIRTESVVIPQDMVVAGPRCTLNALVRAQVEIKLCWVGDSNVNCCACRDVARAARLLLEVSTEEASVVTLLNNNKGNAWLVVRLQFDASLPDGSQLMLQNLQKLTLRNTIPAKEKIHKDKGLEELIE